MFNNTLSVSSEYIITSRNTEWYYRVAVYMGYYWILSVKLMKFQVANINEDNSTFDGDTKY